MRFGLVVFTILLVGGISVGTSYALTEIANDDVYIPAHDKFYLDGGVNTWIWETSPDKIGFVAGGGTRMIVEPTKVSSIVDFSVHPAKKVFLDGGSNTWIWEASADKIGIVAGGGTRMIIEPTKVTYQNTQFVLQHNQKLFLDSGGDSYLIHPSPNVIEIVTGGNTKMSLGNDICIGTCS